MTHADGCDVTSSRDLMEIVFLGNGDVLKPKTTQKKKKKQQNEPKTMTNSTTKVERPMKQSLIVAAICLKAFWKLSSRQNLSMLVNTVKETV